MKVSLGCKNCYAERLTTERMGLKNWGKSSPRKVTSESTWAKPLAWNKKCATSGNRDRVFCASLCDVFEDHAVANRTRPDVWRLIKATPNLDWLMLTKRPERIADCLPVGWDDGWRNVWLGTSIESNDYATRADYLRTIPAVVRFISYEPALGPLDKIDLTGIHWVIYGGESGPGFRAEDKEWARGMMSQCAMSGVAFYHKQSAAYRTGMGVELDGRIVHEYPTSDRKCSNQLTMF
jgi:protein gp37